jgi:hypothetical protein
MTGRTLSGNIGKQIPPTDFNAGVIAAGNVPQCIPLSVSGPSRFCGVIKRLDDPARWFSLPSFADILGPERDKTGCVSNDIEAGAKYRLLIPEYGDAPSTAFSPDIYDCSRGSIRAFNRLADVIARRGILGKEIFDSHLNGRVNAYVRILGGFIETEHWYG